MARAHNQQQYHYFITGFVYVLFSSQIIMVVPKLTSQKRAV